VRYTTTAVGNTSDATTDNLVDSPTQYGHDYGNGGEVVGNYATLNPLVLTDGATISNGNLNITGITEYRTTPATIAMTSGKWYWENRLLTFNSSIDIHFGVCLENFTSFQGTWVLSTPNGWGYTCQGGYGYHNNTLKNISSSVRSAGDTIGLAFDADAGNLYAYVNGAVVNGGSPIYTGLTSGPYFPFVTSGNSSGSVACNFGQRPWAYAPPAGYNALTTKNLPRLAGTALAPQEHFKAVAYTAAGTVQAVNAGFTPDLVWIKGRSGLFTPNAMSSGIYDTVRGGGVSLSSEATSVEYNYATHPNGDLAMDFTSTGFTTPPVVNNNINYNGASYVAWMWKAGGAAVNNTAGTITSQVSANTSAGFSVVTYTGNGTTGATIGHGLGVTPKIVIVKNRDTSSGDIGGWLVSLHSSVTGTKGYMRLDTTGQLFTTFESFNVNFNSTVIETNSNTTYSNRNSEKHIAYCWAEVPGFSKFGTYIGNGSANGTFVYTGFKPAFLLAKRYDTGSSENWFIVDSARNTFNPANSWLSPSLVNDEGDDVLADLLSNGFKLRSTAINANAGTYIYMAFAEKPFGNVNGTAR
jgi:hypothetical protein